MTAIFFVDDAPEIRDVVTTFLSDEGFDVTPFARAEEALARLVAPLPDLLILDGRLPGMSGWQCLAALRATEHTIDLPVLMLTAALDDLESGKQAPPDDCTTHLAKPFDIDELLDAIREVIETCHQTPVAV